MLFFELLQIALGSRDRLSSVPTAEEWEEIYEESGRQAVTGILLHGIDRLPTEQRPSQDILLQWIGEGQMIEQQNLMMDKRCCQLLKMLERHGLKGSILKGQGIAFLYDNELRPLRQSGDIDAYVDCGLKGALEFAKLTGQKDVEWDYKHLHLNVWDDTEVEMHYRVEVLLNLWKNRRLQRWFKEHEKDIFNLNGNLDLNSDTNVSSEHKLPLIDHELSINASSNTKATNGLVTPTVEFDVFYILLHIYRHFLYEGVGMRQLMDYYFVLRHVDATENAEIIKTLKEFGMMRFARGVMWVMQKVFRLENEYLICEPLEREGRFILKEVMAGGNFGHYDERININRHSKIDTVKAICKHNWHLMQHYPSEVVWPPIWFVWHKLWKIKTKISL